MTVTNHAVNDEINLLTELNRKLEYPLLQSEMGLDALATATKQAVRWDEFSQKHNNDGTFKTGAINQADINLTTQATAGGKPVRRDEFSIKHNDDGTFKTGAVNQADVNLTTQANASGKAVRRDEFSARHNDSGTIKQQMFKKSDAANPSTTANTLGTAVNSAVPANWTGLFPQGIDIVFGGTFGSETVTAQITATSSDASQATLTKTATATGTVSLSNADMRALMKDGTIITQLSYQSQSTIASSTAIVTFTRHGLYI